MLLKIEFYAQFNSLLAWLNWMDVDMNRDNSYDFPFIFTQHHNCSTN
jgi:hypothetical protein